MQLKKNSECMQKSNIFIYVFQSKLRFYKNAQKKLTLQKKVYIQVDKPFNVLICHRVIYLIKHKQKSQVLLGIHWNTQSRLTYP